MPETFRGLWRQRLRWAVGGTQTILDSTPALWSGKRWRLLPIWINYVVSILWAYAVVIGAAFWAIAMVGIKLPEAAPIFSPIPGAWGIVLAATYLLQTGTSVLLDSKFEPRFGNVVFWIVWYPILFWTLQALTAFVDLPKALLRPRGARGTWISPDRGIR